MTDTMLGAIIGKTGADFRLWSHHASLVELCLFDERGETELARLSMTRGEGDVHHVFVEGLKEGARYGFRIHGPYDPAEGHWYDPSKLLIDPTPPSWTALSSTIHGLASSASIPPT